MGRTSKRPDVVGLREKSEVVAAGGSSPSRKESGARRSVPLRARPVRRRRALPPKADQGKVGGKSVSIITRSRMSKASGESAENKKQVKDAMFISYLPMLYILRFP